MRYIISELRYKGGKDVIKVLLVEDNHKISDNIYTYLKEDFQIDQVYTGEDALLHLDAFSYDLVILDLMLPGKGGMSVLAEVQNKKQQLGVIILTAKEDLGDKLRAFQLGAEDYLTKPFFMEELKARMYVILKRLGKMTEENTLVFKDLHLDLKQKSVWIKDEKIELNERLFHLLEYLMLNKDILLFKEQIFERICGYDSDASTEIIEVYMSHLRKKLSPFGYDVYVVTKRGMGYMLEDKK